MKKRKNILLSLTCIFFLASCNSITIKESSSKVDSSFSSTSSKDDSSSKQAGSSSQSVSSSESQSGSTSSSSSYEYRTDKTLLWHDEFEGNSINQNKWAFDIGNGTDGWGNWEKQYYLKENATVSDGTLKITAKKESYGGCSYTSAKLKTLGKLDFTYGYVEARIKLPAISGTWPAFWMLPSSSLNGKGWPWSGEIDIMENKGNQSNIVSSTLHSAGDANQTYSHYATKEYTTSSSVANWHTYAVDWRNKQISFYVDDILFQTVTQDMWRSSNYNGYNDGEPFNKKFYIILNLAIGGQFISQALPDDSLMPASMEVDYVRVYN